MRRDVADGHAAGVQAEDLVVQARQPGLALADELALKRAVAIAWRADADGPQIGLHGLRAGAIAHVRAGGRPPGGWPRCSRSSQRGLEHATGQLRQQPARPVISSGFRPFNASCSPADPQGQAGQAQRVSLRRADRRDHPEHQARSARPDRAGASLLARREPAAPANRRRARPAWPVATGGRAGRRLQRRPDDRAARRPRASGSPSPGASHRAPENPNDGCSATAPVPKDASATSNAATACGAAA